MTNIVITAAAVTLTLSVPTGTLISVRENNQEIAVVGQAQAQPVEQINVVVDIQTSGQMGSQVTQITTSTTQDPQPALTPTIPSTVSGVPEPKNMLPTDGRTIPAPEPQNKLPTDGRTIAAPQPVINNFQNVPNAAPADYSNIIRNPGNQSSSSTSTEYPNVIRNPI